ncbi:hypothetical protein ABI59_20435 [Acidobacteria bacterium Mor1]|nr:hypothetical protein ABI59_20435 [Acidobacteria bacterium Mor1]
MNAFDTARIGFKLVAILVLIKAIEMLGWILGVAAMPEIDGYEQSLPLALAAHLVPFSILLLFAAVLLLKSSALAYLAVGEPEESRNPTEVALYPALLSAVGALLIGMSLTGLPEVFVTVSIVSDANFAPERLDGWTVKPETRYWMYGVVLQFVAGLVLLLGSRRIAPWILAPARR